MCEFFVQEEIEEWWKNKWHWFGWYWYLYQRRDIYTITVSKQQSLIYWILMLIIYVSAKKVATFQGFVQFDRYKMFVGWSHFVQTFLWQLVTLFRLYFYSIFISFLIEENKRIFKQYKLFFFSKYLCRPPMWMCVTRHNSAQ